MNASVPRATRRQVARDHLGFAERRDPGVLVATALRTKSVHSREILAEAAWPGHTPADVELWSGEQGAQVLPEMDVPWLGRLAHVVALQDVHSGDRRAGKAILEAIARTGRLDELDPLTIELLLQLRLAAAERQGAAQLVNHPAVRDLQRAAVRVDLRNPTLFPGAAEESVWLRAFNDALHSSDVADLSLRRDSGGWAPFDRLEVRDVRPVDSPYRVSVLMSCYRPGAEILTAARSVLAQSWQNLELIIVDDASGAAYRSILDQLAQLDSRVRVVRKAVNGGTYRARNTALRLATGDYCAVVDSDDWLHPQGLEMHLRPLLDDPSLVGTISEGVRVTEDLVLNRPGYLPRVSSAASLTFRLGPVLSRIGFFDPTSKGADTEFIKRIEAAFGQRIRYIREVLSILRAGQSLSSAEFSRGWRHPARHAYKSAYRPWHSRIAQGLDSPFLDPDEPRRFPEPRRWVKSSVEALRPTRHVDLCLAGDWRRHGGPQRSMLEELRAARAAGLRVAIMHLEAFRFMTRKDVPLSDPVMSLVNSGVVEWIHPDDDVEINVLLLRYPPILQYPPFFAGRVHVRHLLVMANQAPLEPDGRDQRYVVSDVTARAAELFGVPPAWVPQSPVIRRILLDQDPDVSLTPWDNPGLIDVAEWHVRPPRPVGQSGRVVVGRYSRDDPMKFPPTWEDLSRAYDLGPEYEVRMMGGANTPALLAEAAGVERSAIPSNWVLTRHGSSEVTDFLGELDFFVYMDNPLAHEAFGRSLLEAAASGVLTIAHPKHRMTFGDVLDYATVDGVRDLIAYYAARPDAYQDRVARSRRAVEDRFGHRGFIEKLLPLLEGGSDRVGTEESDRSMCDASVEVAPSPGHRSGAVVVSTTPRWSQRRMRLRSAADAERADALTVVFLAGHEHEVRRWLEGLATMPPDDLASALCKSAPTAIVLLITERDGHAQLVSRTQIRGLSGEALRVDGADWFVRAWWTAGESRAIHVT